MRKNNKKELKKDFKNHMVESLELPKDLVYRAIIINVEEWRINGYGQKVLDFAQKEQLPHHDQGHTIQFKIYYFALNLSRRQFVSTSLSSHFLIAYTQSVRRLLDVFVI